MRVPLTFYYFRVNLHNIINTFHSLLLPFSPLISFVYISYYYINALLHQEKNKFTENGINVNVYFWGGDLCRRLVEYPPFFLFVRVWVSVSVRS